MFDKLYAEHLFFYYYSALVFELAKRRLIFMRRYIVLKIRIGFLQFCFWMFTVIIFFVGSVISSVKMLIKYKTITVRQGDTLWDIASKHCGKMEIRQYIYQIKKGQ